MNKTLILFIIRFLGLFALGLAIYWGIIFFNYNRSVSILRNPFSFEGLWVFGILLWFGSGIGLLLVKNIGRWLFIASISATGLYTAFVLYAFSGEGNNPTLWRAIAGYLMLITVLLIVFLNLKSVKAIFRKEQCAQQGVPGYRRQSAPQPEP